MTRTAGAALLVLSTLSALPAAARTEQRPHAGEATHNPLSRLNLLRLEPSYEHTEAGADVTALLLRGQLVYPGILLPGLSRPEGFFTVLRLDLLAKSRHEDSERRAVGLGDFGLLALVARDFGWVAVGAGLAMIVPSATDPLLGAGQLQLGPALAVVVTGVPRTRLGLLVRNYFSLAGDPSRPSLDQLTLQPRVSVHLGERVFVESDPIMTFDWTAGGEHSIPVNLLLGGEVSSRMALLAGPEWVATGRDRDNVKVLLRIDYAGW